MKKLYISGKITGIEDQAPELFKLAEEEVRKLGFEPVNPMTINHDHDLTWSSYMKEDLKAMMDCDGVYMLNNWKTSKGANIELDLAESLGMEIYYQKL